MGCVGSVGRATDCECKLALPVAVALWLCSPSVGRDLLVDFAPRQYQTVQQGVGRPEAERLRLRFAKHFGVGNKLAVSFCRWIKPGGIAL